MRGVGFRSLTEAIDTTTSGGRLVFHLFGALGQFERDLIQSLGDERQERTRAGLTAAAARGRKGGRKPVVTSDKLDRARSGVTRYVMTKRLLPSVCQYETPKPSRRGSRRDDQCG
jgi:DNA invertase Pin-like site-specific DNA recombinase